jgi:hypothetical protein
MLEVFKFKPQDTDWIRCELFVDYDCATKPKVTDLVITGIKQFGFIISHEYDVKAFVEGSLRQDCKGDCERAVLYTFDVRVYVWNKVGLGFGFGGGTGTLGWTSRSFDHILRFDTRCICCDDVMDSKEASVNRIDSRPRSEVGPVLLTLAAIGGGIAFSIAYSDRLVSQIFLISTGIATLLSILVTIWRVVRSRPRKGGHSGHGLASMSKTSPPA